MDNSQASIKISKKAFLSSVIILLVLMIGAGVLTHVIPAGHFERAVVDGRETVVPNTFAYSDEGGYPVWRWLTAPVEVLWSEDAVTVIFIIAFICIIGGTFTVLEKSGMLRYVMNGLVKRFGRSRYLLMAVLVLFFMLFGSVFGIFEEMVALVPMVILLSYALGWDSLVGLGMSALAAGFGFSASTLNPFTVGVAQKLAGLAPFSGVGFRLLVFAIFYAVLYLFLLFYAKRLEKDPTRSSVYAEDKAQYGTYTATAHEPLPNEAYLGRSVVIFSSTIALVILYIVVGFFVPALSSLAMPVMAVAFCVGGLCAVRASHYGGHVGRDFLAGLGGIAPSALLILMAMSVKLIITRGGIMDTILYYVSEKASGMGPQGAVIVMFLLVLMLNFFISAGSAKAFLLMPLLAPLSDMVGVSGQVAVLAFCFGDGFTNMLYPTNALLMIALGLTTVSYPKWFRFTIGLQAVTLVLNVALLLLAVAIGY